MSHGPATEWKENKALEKKKSRLGVLLFVIYTAVYTGFILINVINPKVMRITIGSLNVAIIYGFGLIILALVLAVFYNHICTTSERAAEVSDKR